MWAHTDMERSWDPIEPLGGRILAVDDNDANRALIEVLLRQRGLECDLARNGQVALEMMRERPYDLVLLDMEMPVQDGWTTIDVIRQDPELADTPVVAVTAHALKGSIERCMEAGCNAQLSKPFSQEELYGIVHRWLRKAQDGDD